MIIKLSPQRSDRTLTIEKQGDKLILNGEEYDFTALPEGGLLPQDAITSDFIVSDVERIAGEINLTLLLPHGPDAPEHIRFPEPLHATSDGEVTLA